jgi:hypothetical protein
VLASRILRNLWRRGRSHASFALVWVQDKLQERGRSLRPLKNHAYNTGMFPLDDQDMEIVAPESWLRLGSIVAMALAFFGQALDILPRGLAAKVLAVRKPGEAMARRLLYLIAPEMSVPPAKAGPSGHAVNAPTHPSPVSPAQAGAASRKAAFRFTEPLGSAPKPQGPRIRFLDGPSLPPKPQRPARAPQSGARLLARIMALQDVINHPDAHAKRLARWLARRRAAGAKRPVPFNFDNVPGLNRQRLDPDLRADAEFLNAAAHYKATAPPG